VHFPCSVGLPPPTSRFGSLFKMSNGKFFRASPLVNLPRRRPLHAEPASTSPRCFLQERCAFMSRTFPPERNFNFSTQPFFFFFLFCFLWGVGLVSSFFGLSRTEFWELDEEVTSPKSPPHLHCRETCIPPGAVPFSRGLFSLYDIFENFNVRITIDGPDECFRRISRPINTFHPLCRFIFEFW